MTSITRRTVLKGLVAGAGLALTGIDVARAAGAPAAPGSRPYPRLPAGVDTLPQVEHIVVLMMENHSFDNYFGMLGRGDGLTVAHDGRPRNANPGPAGAVRSFHAASSCQAQVNISQSWDTSHQSWNAGRCDGFVNAKGVTPMAYFDGRDIPFYYSLARTFPICDRYFSSVMAQTYPNRRFLLAATALGQVGDPFPNVVSPQTPPNGTIFEMLSAHGISWKDYFVDLPTTGLFPSTVYSHPGQVVPVADFFVDAAAGTLPSVSLVDPESWQGSEENPQDIHTGEYYASLIINAVLDSPVWDRTVLVLTYDEHGGYYDHVAPPRAVRPDSIRPEVPASRTYGDLYSYYGFRVPTVIVSPWARRNYVSHVVHDHTSILKLIETKWNLPALTYRDANASNLLDSLDFRHRAFAEPPKLAPAPLPTGAVPCYLQHPSSPL